ncbi:uncharacterized protein F4812DRAFT_170135 [Daldinia caldariorum]|uniref:uncharacterized protein n=1 Tax=Daldinia caldariorum TaxID=326644 RepID=UPI0020081F91|nr:uncharacterized protein F4812DRAFT_170135 [Daldinia caldariorum]KAI1471201.1 hypothetical protein F4812DRAFT_170135 [Daldinia caldariorum]
MGTPFISHLEPTRLDGYDRTRPHDQQPARVPRTFCDAMSVREAVFVREQGVPLANEHDPDDARSCHWVTYASVNFTTEPERRHPTTGEVLSRRKSETRTLAIGTLRVVPFPHPPHPLPGGRYVNNVLVLVGDDEYDDEENEKKGADGSGNGNGNGSGSGSTAPSTTTKRPRTRTLSSVDEERQASALPFGTDRPTTYHDGKEPYVKLGRMAVIPEFRGHHIAAQLWRAARRWLEENPAFFNPSVTQLGMDQLKVCTPGAIPKWNGLVCCHAQEGVVKLYRKWGFKVDEGMGRWYEEGIPHVGMFLRLPIQDGTPKV